MEDRKIGTEKVQWEQMEKGKKEERDPENHEGGIKLHSDVVFQEYGAWAHR